MITVGKGTEKKEVLINRGFFGGGTWVEISKEEAQDQFSELENVIKQVGEITSFIVSVEQVKESKSYKNHNK